MTNSKYMGGQGGTMMMMAVSYLPALALGHIKDFIYYAYAGLLKEQTLHTFCLGSLEAIVNLACYHLTQPPPSLLPCVMRIVVE
jgi:hypothetical protein